MREDLWLTQEDKIRKVEVDIVLEVIDVAGQPFYIPGKGCE